MTNSLAWTPAADDVQWSVKVVDPDSGAVLVERDASRLLRSASLGKIFALRGAADALTRNPDTARLRLPKPVDHAVADSGLWQHLAQADLGVEDVATLVASCSDNLAANALISWLGVDSLRSLAAAWAPGGSTLYDYFRDERDERDESLPETVSRGCADDYAAIMTDLSLSSVPSLRVMRTWLRRSVDFSMVGAATYLDPLSNTGASDVRFMNKTGCDDGVRADVGVVGLGEHRIAYAAIANWGPGAEPGRTETVVEDLRRLGSRIRERLGRTAPSPAPAPRRSTDAGRPGR